VYSYSERSVQHCSDVYTRKIKLSFDVYCFDWLTVFASQVVFISWVFPRVVSECVLVVMPRKSDGNVMPSRRATDANSVSPLATTSPDPLSTKLTFPKSSTAANTLTTSMNGIPRRPLRTENKSYYNIMLDVNNVTVIVFKRSIHIVILWVQT